MRLLKLAAMGLFGYAVFEFIRGMLQEAEGTVAETQAARSGGRSSKGQPGRRRGASAKNRSAPTDPLILTGPGQGVEEATADIDGGTVRHKVGRGVVS